MDCVIYLNDTNLTGLHSNSSLIDIGKNNAVIISGDVIEFSNNSVSSIIYTGNFGSQTYNVNKLIMKNNRISGEGALTLLHGNYLRINATTLIHIFNNTGS